MRPHADRKPSETHIWEAPGGAPKIQQRALNIESDYEYGSRSGVWRLFRLFDKHDIKFTLYAVVSTTFVFLKVFC